MDLLSPSQILVLLGMAAFVYYLFRSDSGSSLPWRRGATKRAVGPRSSERTTNQAQSLEVQRLHTELLALVYGDEKLLKRLVDFERRTQPTREACYRAAINRLLRDRLN